MQHKLIFILFMFLTKFSSGQIDETWISFYDSTTELIGYKDLKGNIKIPAKFSNLTRADTFYNIIAVSENTDSSYQSYYLLKDGRRVGIDSVFMFDFTYDCESEGKILFVDTKKNRVGFLGKNGKAIIPAIYNAATPFRNGLSTALKNAKRKCWDENEDTLNCEHWLWVGGETVLINDKNEILVDSLTADIRNLNWYSLKINEQNTDTTSWTSIKGNNGNIYSFLNYEKEFKKWFHLKFLAALHSLSSDPLRQLLFSEVTFWSNKTGWTSLSNIKYLKMFPASVTKEKFLETSTKNVSIYADDLNPFIFEGKLYSGFYDACGSHNKEKFPVFNVMITYYKKRTNKLKSKASTESQTEKRVPSDFEKQYQISYQEHFDFIRTAEGYRLLSVSVK